MYNEAKKASNNRYLSQFKTISVRMKHAEAEELENKAAEAGESLAGYILTACRERMTGKHDNMPHDSGTEALPDLLTPYARQLADDASKAAGVEVKSWIEKAVTDTAAMEAKARELSALLAAKTKKE